jgi:hypothetical protein
MARAADNSIPSKEKRMQASGMGTSYLAGAILRNSLAIFIQGAIFPESEECQ